jgi:hypothetical protein
LQAQVVFFDIILFALIGEAAEPLKIPFSYWFFKLKNKNIVVDFDGAFFIFSRHPFLADQTKNGQP